jgi:tRNA pseudouridine32 synthase/23S rRNA pseudouridine746 synthase
MNRPRQKVDYLSGKHAVTRYELLKEVYYDGEQCALVRFTPITGRTHQLRVHAAHADGLDCPIVGDAIYGSAGKRLMLHACSLSFVHPVSGNVVNVESDMEFKE